jgi:UDP-GlcNAc:undecaprenyl-phosphate/decaprenyl-phosphate GlcNAc-1-phosphate transferase
VQTLPLLVSLAAAALIVPAALGALAERGLVRENYRGAALPFPAGVAIVAAALVALVPLALLAELADADVFRPGTERAVLFVLGVALLGLLDDLVGSERMPVAGEAAAPGQPGVGATAADAPPRGWRGHGRATLAGGFSTGTLKAVGTLGLALFVLADRGLGAGEYLLGVGVVVLATNLFNLLDLRPGRSVKAFALLGVGLTLGSFHLDPLWTLGLFVGPILVLAPLDLRERGMLGDTGSNAIGAVAGLWLVLTLSTIGQAIALGLMLVATVYGEFRSISALIEKTPLVRQLDSVGRLKTRGEHA